ncbi:hypothetical protein EOD41_00615 [Mucilaginibacter limnophilus]|uniref:Uncharacterized protein n=1 Tax=Mucilaginibacter limnophilus TaxID=1932778 RepID=A0A437MY00_9SPHI|nr:hypothetical protein [Mucilaginibacter limnophilus]RVU02476.1 hypothetical protein EOD41_00615 [Mucilaginibacter limnophilus]
MDINTANTVMGGNPIGNEVETNEDIQRLSDNPEIEKGSGYGPPNEGSGETVPAQDADYDGQIDGTGDEEPDLSGTNQSGE